MNLPMPSCPKCGGVLEFYDGALGYESFQCRQCRWDINQLNPLQTLAAFQALRGALLAIVACPDYRNTQTHEMTRARKALEDTQP